MNEEQEAKLNWCFEALKSLLGNSHSPKYEINILLDDASRIELDYFKEEEQSLPSKTKDALSEDCKDCGFSKNMHPLRLEMSNRICKKFVKRGKHES